jgi:hypothetical protein
VDVPLVGIGVDCNVAVAVAAVVATGVIVKDGSVDGKFVLVHVTVAFLVAVLVGVISAGGTRLCTDAAPAFTTRFVDCCASRTCVSSSGRAAAIFFSSVSIACVAITTSSVITSLPGAACISSVSASTDAISLCTW